MPFLLKVAREEEHVSVWRAALGSADMIMTPWIRDRAKALQKAQRSRATKSKYLGDAERIISRYDIIGDKALQKSEWSRMLVFPEDADQKRDD